ncbi:MAG: hypothetical protein ABIY71_11985, partial [Flavobacteriales bacterium]
EKEEKKDDLVRAAIHSSMKVRENRIPGLDPSRLFDVEDIRANCVRYRLRFLPASRFKGIIPREAVYAVRQLEDRTEAPLGGFMIMAPAKRFQLCDRDSDPLLFAPLGNGKYYLVHQWGRELHPWRAALGWPVRGWMQLTITVLFLSALFSALVPTAWLSSDPAAPWWGIHRFSAFFSTTMLVCAATAFSWFAFFGQFSEDAWDSKTFN